MECWRKIFTRIQWITIAFAMMLAIAYVVSCFDTRQYSGNPSHEDWKVYRPNIVSISTANPRVARWFFVLYLPVLLINGFLTVVSPFTRPKSPTAPIVGFFVTLGLFFSPCMGFAVNPLHWRAGPPVLGSDGYAYYFMESSFMQGQTLVLAKQESEGWFADQFRVLVLTNGDEPRTWQSMIRPATDDDEGYHAALISSKEVLFGFRYEDHCFMAFDLMTDTRFGRLSIRKVSPFALLDQESKLHQPDVERLIERVRDGHPDQNGVPTLEQLHEGLNHPNPAVAELAEKLLKLKKAN